MSERSDLDICASEPIRTPGTIQPHGALLVVDPATGIVVQASENASAFLSLDTPVGRSLPGGLDELAATVGEMTATGDERRQQALTLEGRMLTVVVQQNAQGLALVEFEERQAGEEQTIEALFVRLQGFSQSLHEKAIEGRDQAAQQTATFVRAITGFDRALVYWFDPDWNGHVLAEDGNGSLPSYLGLRFPSKDIPPQARALYRTNRIRLIPDAAYEPVRLDPALLPASGEPVDLGPAALRSVSPIHLEYMRNMGTAASMSVSIIVDGELWGLVACHSRNPHRVSPNVRAVADFAVQALAAHIGAQSRLADADLRVALHSRQRCLLEAMSTGDDLKAALTQRESDLLAHANAAGAAIVMDGAVTLFGQTPGSEAVADIVAFLDPGAAESFHTDRLSAHMPGADRFAATASGLLAVRISELHSNWLMWFRPELVQTVRWGGDPHAVVRESGRIHPRKSFEAWKDEVRMTAEPWREGEIDAARDLRQAIIAIVLRKAEKLAGLSEELKRSNKELEAFSYSVSHDLRAPFRHIVGFSELLKARSGDLDAKSQHYLESIAESAVAAGRLVDDLLNFSHLGRASLSHKKIDMQKMVSEVQQSATRLLGGRRIVWEVEKLPPAYGDPMLVRQVWQNLVDNAVKYSGRNEAARIGIKGWREGKEICYQVADNGVGFDMAYVGKLFGVFQRLQRSEDFQGTGIGLALVRRIVERHKGRVWAEGVVGEGATFGFSLPARKEETEEDDDHE